MERIFFREKQERPQPEGAERYRIGVTGLGRGVGTTFVAAALAFYFRDQGRQVSFNQCLDPASCSGLLYDQVAMDKRFAHRQFEPVYQKLAEEAPMMRRQNKEAGVLWRLPVPDDCGKKRTLTPRQQARLMAAAGEEVCIFDMEADYSWDDYLMDMDVIFVVVDPLPSKLIRSRERYRVLKKMELAGCRIIWVVNKMSPGVDKKQVKNYLKADYILWMEAVDTRHVYEDEYFCRFHWENAEIQRKFIEIFTKVSRFHSSLSWFSISKDVEM
ncbi:MAG: hypothetical protein IKJ77_09055 [Firmicutes bacterium]|nr:hypothetical protein [Bacillota bacterium]